MEQQCWPHLPSSTISTSAAFSVSWLAPTFLLFLLFFWSRGFTQVQWGSYFSIDLTLLAVKVCSPNRWISREFTLFLLKTGLWFSFGNPLLCPWQSMWLKWLQFWAQGWEFVTQGHCCFLLPTYVLAHINTGSQWSHELRLANETMPIVRERRELRGSETLLLLAGVA